MWGCRMRKQDQVFEQNWNGEEDNFWLQSVVQTQRGQIDELSRKMKESEEARIRDREEINMKQAEMNAKLERLLSESQSG